LPCPHCAGTGLEDVISKEILELIANMRSELYDLIKSQTERLDVAAKSFTMAVRSGLSRNLEEAVKYGIKRRELIRKLGTFPDDYVQIEKDCLVEGWKRAAQLVGSQYKTIVETNSKKVVGNTYKHNAIYEIRQFEEREKCL